MNVQEEIRKLAYDLYEKSGRLGGSELEHWLKAEQIVLAKLGAQAKVEPAKAATERKRKAAPSAGDTTKPKRTGKKPEAKSGEKKRKTKI